MLYDVFRLSRLFGPLAAAVLCVGVANGADDRFFESHVRPLLKTHCFHCHGDEAKHEAGLDLRLVRSMLAGGESGPAIVAGKTAESLLLARIAADEMPPGKKKLTSSEKETILAWLRQGARTRRSESDQQCRNESGSEENHRPSLQTAN